MMAKSMTCTMQEACEFSGLSRYCLKSLIDSNAIVYVKSGRRTYINKASLIDYINGMKTENAKITASTDTSRKSRRSRKPSSTNSEKLEKRKANGICVDCGADLAEPGKTRCKACSERHKASRQELNEYRRKQSLCIKCGKYPVIPDSNYCEICKTKQKLYARRNYDNQLQKRIDDLKAENTELKSKLHDVIGILNDVCASHN